MTRGSIICLITLVWFLNWVFSPELLRNQTFSLEFLPPTDITYFELSLGSCSGMCHKGNKSGLDTYSFPEWVLKSKE